MTVQAIANMSRFVDDIPLNGIHWELIDDYVVAGRYGFRLTLGEEYCVVEMPGGEVDKDTIVYVNHGQEDKSFGRWRTSAVVAMMWLEGEVGDE